MNIKQFILWTTWAGILTGAIYFTQWQEYKHEGVKILVSNTGTRTQEAISPLWDPKVYWIPPEPNLINTNTDIQDFLDKNPILKMRIQNMSWYRDFLTSRISREVFEEYLIPAFNIEGILAQNPWLVEKIQHEIWWQRYLRWYANPVDMFAGNITSLLRLQELEKKDPELYQKMQKNPNWNTWIQHGEDYVVVWQEEIIYSASLRLEQIKTEPWLRDELARFWFSEENVYTDNWIEWRGFYTAVDVVRRILEMDREHLDWFYSTELWQKYLSGEVNNWRELEKSLEE